MRLVVKDLTDLPEIFKKQTTLDQWEEISKGNPDLINDNTYKGTYKDSEGKTQSSVRDKLNVYYHTKCAYCEISCKAEIEHYRPKKGVNEDTTHTGYYWLCYEWSNLVPSCRYCNTEGGKGNQFPVSGTRVKKPAFLQGKLDLKKCNSYNNPLLKENADLLHPEIDDPKLHFEFAWDQDKKGIIIKEKGTSKKARQTIKICNLNRDYLKVDRFKTVLFPLVQQLDYIFSLMESNILPPTGVNQALKLYFLQLDESTKNVQLPYTLLRWYISSSAAAFENIVGPYLSNNNQKQIIIQAFTAYKNGTL